MLSRLTSEITNIQGVIFFIGCKELLDDQDRDAPPTLLVMSGVQLANVIAVALSDDPIVVGDFLPQWLHKRVKAFVATNREVLLAHWRGEIGRRQMVESIGSLGATGDSYE